MFGGTILGALKIAFQGFDPTIQERANRQNALFLRIYEMLRRPPRKESEELVDDCIPPLPDLFANMRFPLPCFFFHASILNGDGGVCPSFPEPRTFRKPFQKPHARLSLIKELQLGVTAFVVVGVLAGFGSAESPSAPTLQFLYKLIVPADPTG